MLCVPRDQAAPERKRSVATGDLGALLRLYFFRNTRAVQPFAAFLRFSRSPGCYYGERLKSMTLTGSDRSNRFRPMGEPV